jgi:hypothetical protein
MRDGWVEAKNDHARSFRRGTCESRIQRGIRRHDAIVLLAFGYDTGVLQSFAFVNADDAWSRHRQARHRIRMSVRILRKVA